MHTGPRRRPAHMRRRAIITGPTGRRRTGRKTGRNIRQGESRRARERGKARRDIWPGKSSAEFDQPRCVQSMVQTHSRLSGVTSHRCAGRQTGDAGCFEDCRRMPQGPPCCYVCCARTCVWAVGSGKCEETRRVSMMTAGGRERALVQ